MLNRILPQNLKKMLLLV